LNVENLRRAYAETICATAGSTSASLIDAFARVPREHFLDPGPWRIAQPFDQKEPYRETPDVRLEHLYQDAAVGIDTTRQINNGQPSAHARWIDAAAPKPGEAVLHIGCGHGYYTAILAEMVGPTGRVEAHEIDPVLAARARTCLSDWPQASVKLPLSRGSDAAADPHSALKGPFDVIYVNAGATHARRDWISSLAPGGRMLLPLTVHVPMFPHGVGFVLCIRRQVGRWPARLISPVGIFDCVGARDAEAEVQLRRLLAPGESNRIHAVTVEPHDRGDDCLVHAEGFCLQA
jgi:protein-L-isoaspartate(D-aspartate) O-methyltransferase